MDKGIFIKAKDVAKAKGQECDRAIRAALNKPNNTYIYRRVKVRGGETYEILLESLEPHIQEILIKEMQFQPPAIISAEKKFIADNAKATALARVDLLKGWQHYRNEQKLKGEGDRLFLELYNTGMLMRHVFGAIGTVSIGTIKRWGKEYNEHKTWEALVPQYKYSSISECKTKLSDEMIEIFLKILLHPNRFSVGKSIKLTIELLKTRGVENIPSIPSFRRYAEHFRKYNFDKWTLLRDGEKALKDKVEPYIQRDISKLEVGDVLVADGHRLNFQVINPFTGKPTRATLVGFLDWKSTALVGYEIMLEENTQCIASALRMAILNLGLIPKIVYQDNGRAFRAKYFQSCNFDEAGFNGVYENLGIKPVFAKPYNARAKVIERFFLEFQEEFEKLMPSYTGTSIENKPAWMNRNEVLHLKLHEKNKFIPTIQQTILLLNKWIEYHNSKPCPNNREMTIQQMLDSVERQPIDVKRLDDLMMSTDVRTIHRNGIIF